MSGDIVERLLDEAPRPAIREVCQEAADEIVRLRAERDLLRDEIKRLVSENAELRNEKWRLRWGIGFGGEGGPP